MAKELSLINNQEEDLVKVTVNKQNDSIFINAKDSKIFDDFAAFLKWIDEKDAEIQAKEKEYTQKYGDSIVKRNEDGEIEEINAGALVEFCSFRTSVYLETVEKLDGIFGEGTIRKYFRAFYEINPDFVPNDECIYDFLDAMTPVLNEIFTDSAKRISLKYNRNRKGGKRTKYRTKEQIIQDAMGK
nr:MAG TPA: tail assembly chaperone protein [Caudoviricetes sp.]